MTLRQKVFSGLFWVAASSLSIQVAAFLASVILARLLAPRDFGLFEIAMIFIALSTVFGDFGFGQALIQWTGDVRKATGTAFVINTALSLLIAGALFALAPAIANFYQTSEVTWVLRALSLNIVFAGLGVVPANLLERELEFRRKSVAEILPQIAYGLVAVAVALAGGGVWSLVAGMIASSFLRTALFWERARFRPVWEFDLAVARRLMGYGVHLVLMSLLLSASGKLDVAYLGRLTDPSQVGFYGLAITVANLSVDLIASLVGRVTFPAFAKLQEEMAQISRAYLRTTNFITYISLPVIAGIFAVAPHAVVGLYGEKWSPAALLVRILCLFALFRSLSRLNASIFTATGRPDIATKITLLRLVVFVAGLLLLGPIWQTAGVALATSLAMMVSGIWSLWLTDRYLDIPHGQFFATIRSQFAAALLMGAAVTLAGTYLPMTIVHLALLIALGVVLYVALLFVFAHQAVRRDIGDILMLLRERRQATTQA